MKRVLQCALTVLLLFISFESFAQVTKTATGSGTWTTATWSPAGVPASNDNIIINSGVVVTVAANTTAGSVSVKGTLTVNNGVTLNVTNNCGVISENNSIAVSGTINGTGTINCGNLVAGTNIAYSSGNTTVQLTIANTTINVTNNLSVASNFNPPNKNQDATLIHSSGIITIGGGIVTINDDASNVSTLTSSTGGTLIIQGNTPFTTAALGTSSITLSGSTTTVVYGGSGNQAIRNTTYDNLTLSTGGVKTAPAGLTIKNLTIDPSVTFTAGSFTHNISGDFVNNGTFTSTGSTMNFNGTAAQSIASTTYNNLTLANTTAAVTAAGSGGTLTVSGTLTVPVTNILDLATNDLSVATVSNSGTIRTQSTSSTPLPTGKTWGGTVQYNSASAQTIVNGTYANLNASGGNRTLSGTINISGVFTAGAGTYTPGSSTVNYNGTGAQTFAAINYNNLTISGARGTSTLTLASGTMGVAGTLSVTATGTITYSNTGNTISFNGTGAQTVPTFAGYATVAIDNVTTSVSVSSAVTIPTALTLASGAILDLGTTGSLAGAFTATGNLGTIRTAVAGATPLISGKTWGGTVEYYGTSAQTIPAGSYTDLLISGSRGANNVTLINGGTISIAGGLTSTASFSGGAFVITNNTVNFNGSGSQTIAAFTYNNLTISGARGTSTFTLGSGTISVAATFSVTATGTLSYVTTGNTFDYNGAGAQTVTAFTYNNLTISGTGRAITLQSSGTISIAGTFTPGTNTFTTTGSTVAFIGGAQTIPVLSYNNLTTNGTGKKSLAGNTTIGGTLTLTAGYIYAGVTPDPVYKITLNTVSGGNNSAYVEGVAEKSGSNISFTFPVGNNSVYAPLTLAIPLGTATTYTAQYFRAPSIALGSGLSGVTQVSYCENWNVQRTAGSLNPTVGLSWSSGSPCGGSGYINDLPTIKIAQLVGSTWTLVGGTASGSTTTGTITTPSGMSSFGYFSLASTSFSLNPLPVSFLSFKATPQNGKVVLDWKVDAETSVTKYEVERSSDGRNYNSIATIAAANTITNSYTFSDAASLKPVAYYRIRSTEQGGRTVLSPVIRINEGMSFTVTKVYPTITRGSITLQHEASNSASTIRVLSVTGKLLKEQVPVKNAQQTIIDLSGYPAGIYLVQFRGSNGIFETLKVIKQ